MRFNSVKGGDYSSGARAVNKNSDASFDASRKSSFDFTAVSKTAIAARSKERTAAMQSAALVDKTKIQADSLVDRTKLKIKTEKDIADIKRPAKRMAGVVAGLGALSTGAINMKEAREAKAERAELKLERDKITALQQKTQAEAKTWREKIEGLLTQQLDDSDSETKPDTKTKPDTSSSTSSKLTPAASGSSTLTPIQESVASAVRQVEVGDLGYDGFNQFGDAGGHSNRGTGGKYGTKFGTPLTSMSISDVMSKQSRHNDKSLSDSDWQSSGGIWAAGAYQFIPETLKGVVERSGIDVNRPFDKATQDELFKFHAGEIKGGKIGSTWIGMQNYSQAERDRFNSLLQSDF